MSAETNLLLRVSRRAGRVKRWVRRRVYERDVGGQYERWLADAMNISPGTTRYVTTISIIVPVYDPPLNFLRECLESVVGQQARNWQLVIANDGSTKSEISEYLAAFAARHRVDGRILVLEKENGGISSALNAALERATGEYVGMLDHDDMLDPRCIDEFSRALEANSLPDAVYSDEDKVNPRGEHFDVYCKPGFSPELLLTQMYLCHFTVFRRRDIVSEGGLRSDMDGAQDFDLALRLLPKLDRVVHIALPLYHWRAWSESTALTIDAKPWTQTAAARVQQEHLDRTFGGGTVGSSSVPGLNEVHPRVKGDPLVSVIIPTVGKLSRYSNSRLVDDAVHSLMDRETEAAMEIIVVTTGVIPDVHVELHGKHVIRHVVHQSDAFDSSEAFNAGRAAATGDYLLLLNDDTTVAEPNPVTRMLEIGQIPGVGVVGCKLTYPDGRLQHVGLVMLPSGPTHCWIGSRGKEPGYFGSTLTPRDYLAVTSAAMLLRTSVFDALGGFDPSFARDYSGIDFCLRAHASGHRVAWTPYAHFTRYEGATMGWTQANSAEGQLFGRRWAQAYPVDPYYSSALNQQSHRLYETL